MYDKELEYVKIINNDVVTDTTAFLEKDSYWFDTFNFTYHGHGVRIPIDNPDTNQAVQNFLQELIKALNQYKEEA